MDSTSLSKRELKSHATIWILITLYLLFIDHGDAGVIMEVFVQVLITLRYMFTFYCITLYILPKYYRVDNGKFMISSILLYAVYEIVNYLTFFYIMTMFGDPGTYDNTPFYEWLLTSSIFFLIVAVVALGSYQNRMIRLEMQKQSEKEKILLIKELGFLKNQFNSHITLNFLNYCYSYLIKSSKEAAEAIEIFSDMIKYVIITKPDELIPLKRELEHIQQFIALHNQLNPGVCVNFNNGGDMNNKFILPCILTTFVENAFKHGVSHNKDTPIHITVNSFASYITFSVRNQKNYQNRISSGIGLYNLKKQLELFYKSKHELIIQNEGHDYFCELKLSI